LEELDSDGSVVSLPLAVKIETSHHISVPTKSTVVNSDPIATDDADDVDALELTDTAS